MLYQQKFLTSLIQSLDNEDSAQKVIADLNQLRSIITSPTNLALHVAADWRKMESLNVDLNFPWCRIVKPGESPCREK